MLRVGKTKPIKIVEYGISETKNGDPQAFIMFECKDPDGGDGSRASITWYGSFKSNENGQPKDTTIKALMTCGFKSNDLAILLKGVDGGGLNVDAEVEIEIESNEYEDKSSLQVRWINKPYEVKKMEASKAIMKLKGMNLGGDLMRIAQENGVTLGHQAPQQNLNPPTAWEDDDIPF